MLNKITSHDQSAILDLSFKGVRIDQIHERFRNVSITDIRDLCNNYYQNQNESKPRGDKSPKNTGKKRDRKVRV